MNTITSQGDVQFQAFLAKLVVQPRPVWSVKQRMELEMARRVCITMRELGECLRNETPDLESCLEMLKYSKVLSFMMRSLSMQCEIDPQVLRTLFKLVQLPVLEAYPE